MRIVTSIAYAASLVFLAPVTAEAHAALKTAVPAAGSTVRQAPDALDLTFGESVEAALCRVRLTSASGQAVATAKPTGTGRTLHVALEKPLVPGRYTVTWHAVAVDTHPTSGSYTFTVAP